MMYKVKVLIGKEIVEVEVKAEYVFVDGNNNLVFENSRAGGGEPVAMISAKWWINVRRA